MIRGKGWGSAVLVGWTGCFICDCILPELATGYVLFQVRLCIVFVLN
jgi:hypothetical protein